MSSDAIARWRVRAGRRWLIPTAIWSFFIGLGTLQHLAGHPDDAPHLHASDWARGWLWIALSAIALILLLLDRRGSEMRTRAASALLLIMPAVRAVSYTIAYWLSVSGEDAAGVGPWWGEGSPQAWYTCLPWWIITWAILSQAIEIDLLRRAVRGYASRLFLGRRAT